MPNYTFTVHTKDGAAHPGNVHHGETEDDARSRLRVLWDILGEGEHDKLVVRIDCDGTVE